MRLWSGQYTVHPLWLDSSRVGCLVEVEDGSYSGSHRDDSIPGKDPGDRHFYGAASLSPSLRYLEAPGLSRLSALVFGCRWAEISL